MAWASTERFRLAPACCRPVCRVSQFCGLCARFARWALQPRAATGSARCHGPSGRAAGAPDRCPRIPASSDGRGCRPRPLRPTDRTTAAGSTSAACVAHAYGLVTDTLAGGVVGLNERLQSRPRHQLRHLRQDLLAACHPGFLLCEHVTGVSRWLRRWALLHGADQTRLKPDRSAAQWQRDPLIRQIAVPPWCAHRVCRRWNSHFFHGNELHCDGQTSSQLLHNQSWRLASQLTAP